MMTQNPNWIGQGLKIDNAKNILVHSAFILRKSMLWKLRILVQTIPIRFRQNGMTLVSGTIIVFTEMDLTQMNMVLLEKAVATSLTDEASLLRPDDYVPVSGEWAGI